MKMQKALLAGISTFCALSISAGAASITYIPSPGDSFWTVADDYGVAAGIIQTYNNLHGQNVLELGTTLKLPATSHTAKSGESYFKIAKGYGASFEIMKKVNNATDESMLDVGQNVVVPKDMAVTYQVQPGESLWSIAQKHGYDFNSFLAQNNLWDGYVVEPGQLVRLLDTKSPNLGTSAGGQNSKTFETYTVKQGDTLWGIAIYLGIPFTELLSTNGLTESSTVRAGQSLTYPVYHIAVKETPGPQYGEYLDWFTEAQYVVPPMGGTFEVIDFYTGKSFKAQRSTGAGHADCETMTLADTNTMKEIWGGFNWNTRPVIVVYKGRRIAASATSTMHAGNDDAPGGVWTDWRSGNYGAGQNFDWVKGNGAHGHFDIYFGNSIRHKDGKPDANHQAKVLEAAGK